MIHLGHAKSRRAAHPLSAAATAAATVSRLAVHRALVVLLLTGAAAAAELPVPRATGSWECTVSGILSISVPGDPGAQIFVDGRSVEEGESASIRTGEAAYVLSESLPYDAEMIVEGTAVMRIVPRRPRAPNDNTFGVNLGGTQTLDIWTTPLLTDTYEGHPAVVSADETMVMFPFFRGTFGSGQLLIVAVLVSSSAVQWAFEDTDDPHPDRFEPFLDPLGRLVVATPGAVHCLNTTTGETVWRHAVPDGDSIVTDAVTAPDFSFYFYTAEQQLVRLSRDGALLSSVTVPTATSADIFPNGLVFDHTLRNASETPIAITTEFSVEKLSSRSGEAEIIGQLFPTRTDRALDRLLIATGLDAVYVLDAFFDFLDGRARRISIGGGEILGMSVAGPDDPRVFYLTQTLGRYVDLEVVDARAVAVDRYHLDHYLGFDNEISLFNLHLDPLVIGEVVLCTLPGSEIVAINLDDYDLENIVEDVILGTLLVDERDADAQLTQPVLIGRDLFFSSAVSSGFVDNFPDEPGDDDDDGDGDNGDDDEDDEDDEYEEARRQPRPNPFSVAAVRRVVLVDVGVPTPPVFFVHCGSDLVREKNRPPASGCPDTFLLRDYGVSDLPGVEYTCRVGTHASPMLPGGFCVAPVFVDEPGSRRAVVIEVDHKASDGTILTSTADAGAVQFLPQPHVETFSPTVIAQVGIDQITLTGAAFTDQLQVLVQGTQTRLPVSVLSSTTAVVYMPIVADRGAYELCFFYDAPSPWFEIICNQNVTIPVDKEAQGQSPPVRASSVGINVAGHGVPPLSQAPSAKIRSGWSVTGDVSIELPAFQDGMDVTYPQFYTRQSLQTNAPFQQPAVADANANIIYGDGDVIMQISADYPPRMLWQRPLPFVGLVEDAAPALVLSPDSSLVFVSVWSHTTIAFDSVTGSQQWMYRSGLDLDLLELELGADTISDFVPVNTVVGDSQVVACQVGFSDVCNCRGLDAATGALVWEVEIPNCLRVASIVPSNATGTVYVATQGTTVGGELHSIAVHAEPQATRLLNRLRDPPIEESLALSVDGALLLLLTTGQQMVAVSTADGQQEWSTETDFQGYSSLAVTEDLVCAVMTRDILVAVSALMQSGVHCADVASGEMVWATPTATAPLPGLVHLGGPMALPEHGTLVMMLEQLEGAVVYVFDLDDGTLLDGFPYFIALSSVQFRRSTPLVFDRLGCIRFVWREVGLARAAVVCPDDIVSPQQLDVLGPVPLLAMVNPPEYTFGGALTTTTAVVIDPKETPLGVDTGSPPILIIEGQIVENSDASLPDVSLSGAVGTSIGVAELPGMVLANAVPEEAYTLRFEAFSSGGELLSVSTVVQVPSCETQNPNSVAEGARCVCRSGYAPASSDGACVPLPVAMRLGRAFDAMSDNVAPLAQQPVIEVLDAEGQVAEASGVMTLQAGALSVVEPLRFGVAIFSDVVVTGKYGSQVEMTFAVQALQPATLVEVPLTLNATVSIVACNVSRIGSVPSGDGFDCLCGPGQESSRDGASCVPCAPGSYSSGLENACTACPDLATTAAQGARNSTECRCPAGSVLDGDVCLCGPGFESTSDSAGCVPCQPGFFKDSLGVSACVPCVSNAITLGGGARTRDACLCEADFYREEASGNCVVCPPEARCTDLGLDEATLPARPGFWRNPEADGVVFIECEPPDACLGGLATLDGISCDGNGEGSVCASGSCGPACGACLADFASTGFGCDRCPDAAVSATLLLIAILLMFVLLTALTISNLRGKTRASALCKVGTNYLQVVSMLRFYQVPWPPMLDSLFLAQQVGSTPLSTRILLDCAVTRDVFHQATLVMLFPVMLLLLASLFWGSMALLSGRSRHIIPRRLSARVHAASNGGASNGGGDGDGIPMELPPGQLSAAGPVGGTQAAVTGWIVTSIVALFLTYPAVLAHVFSVFNCRSVGTREVLVLDTTIDCWTGRHSTYVAIATVFLFLYGLGLPLAALGLLFRVHGRVKGDPVARQRFGFLTADYVDKMFWFESLTLMRKWVVALLSTFAAATVTQATLTLFWLQLCLAAVLWLDPFVDPVVKRADVASLVISIGTLHAGVLYAVDDVGAESSAGIAIASMVVIANLVFVLTIAWLLFKRAILRK